VQVLGNVLPPASKSRYTHVTLVELWVHVPKVLKLKVESLDSPGWTHSELAEAHATKHLSHVHFQQAFPSEVLQIL